MSTRAIKRERSSFQAWLQKESTAGLVFSLPFIFGFLMFMAIPMGLSLYYSFCKYDIQTPPQWIGLDNYVRIFTNDKIFSKALGVTCYLPAADMPGVIAHGVRHIEWRGVPGEALPLLRIFSGASPKHSSRMRFFSASFTAKATRRCSLSFNTSAALLLLRMRLA